LGEFIRRPAIRWPVRACYGRVRDERAWFRNTGTWLVEDEYLHVPRPASRGAGIQMDGVATGARKMAQEGCGEGRWRRRRCGEGLRLIVTGRRLECSRGALVKSMAGMSRSHGGQCVEGRGEAWWLILPRRGAYDCSRSAEAAYEEGRNHVHDTSSVGGVVALTQEGLV
jgi:hypothetical protein